MAPIVPDKKKIKSFRSEAVFGTWLAANHAQETELWLRLYKKGSGVPTVTHAQAIDVALCWGWIDGIRKALDESSFGCGPATDHAAARFRGVAHVTLAT